MCNFVLNEFVPSVCVTAVTRGISYTLARFYT